jgi:hypothetical protein
LFKKEKEEERKLNDTTTVRPRSWYKNAKGLTSLGLRMSTGTFDQCLWLMMQQDLGL